MKCKCGSVIMKDNWSGEKYCDVCRRQALGGEK